MRIFKDCYIDKKTGKKKQSRKYTIDFTDHNGIRHRLGGLTSKRQTQSLADNIEELVSCKIQARGQVLKCKGGLRVLHLVI